MYLRQFARSKKLFEKPCAGQGMKGYQRVNLTFITYTCSVQQYLSVSKVFDFQGGINSSLTIFHVIFEH